MAKLKKIIRVGLPETNSSSSHAVIISRLSSIFRYEDIMLNEEYITEDNKLLIPSGYKFDFGNSGFYGRNDVITKVVYCIALFSSRNSLHKTLRFLDLMRSILRPFLDVHGLDGIQFGSIDEINNSWKNCWAEDRDYFLYELSSGSFGYVDHQSTDLIYEVIENKESLKNFIYNPDSWLFIGSDCHDTNKEIEKILKKHYSTGIEKKTIIVSVELGYNLGRVDFELEEDILSDKGLMYSLLSERDRFLDEIWFNPEKNIFEENEPAFAFDAPTDKLYAPTSSLVPHFITWPDGIYLIFVNSKFVKIFSKWVSDNICVPVKELNNTYKQFESFLEESKLVENIDWKRFKVSINTEEFGKL